MTRSLTRRQLVLALGGLSGMALLAACGQSEPTPTAAPATGSSAASPTAAPVSGSTASPTAPAVVQNPGSKVKVVYWGSFSGNLGEAEQGMVKRFNESQNDVEVEYQYQGNYEETAQKLTQALAAGTTPDIVLLSDVWWFKFYLNDVLLPLNELFATHQIDTSDYVDPLIEEGTRKGVIYWVPFARSTPLFYYNKQVWQEAGLPDRGPATWDEFVEWTAKLVKKESGNTTRYSFAHPGAASYIAWLFQPVVWQWGGRYSDPDFTIRIHEEPAVEAGRFYLSSVRDGWAVSSKDIVADFVNGAAAAMMASTASLRGITNSASFPVGTAFLPEGPNGFGCCTGGAGLAILKNKPKEVQEAAFRYLAFATSPENTMWWSQNTGYMPVRKSAIASQEMQQFYQQNPNFKTAVDQLPKTRQQDAARVWIPNGDQIIGKGLERVTVQQEDPAAVFAEVARTLEREARPVVEQLERREG
ncbi:extracellular solute-binding protein [Thermomicrobium sp. 4228-Ro]|uniref:extracellular solute-binding protein n=1 Tax=Thermomicrobium sp. 4228-Ro TaxID=2993937 RepID=UPI00224927E2|nr:extracellular solute-binding protein [Thermomicrobium sp. 4228-Ro]MCX2728268.1 extracellular solute-binding protein [Thermomicrobium sp. 4228-Ro]